MMFGPETKVLVVDDMSTMRKIVSKALQGFGMKNIKEASDGVDAWAKMEAEQPPFELIISDWNMPNMTGIDLLKKVRADARFAKIPFILLTAESEASQVKEAVVAGVTNYIVKPFTPETLKAKLEATYQKVSQQKK
jgi:two-component system chemotaxis response regulator CheY